MNFSFGFGRTPNTTKVIQSYLKVRLEEKRTLSKQLQRLDAQLKEKTIDKQTYKRLKDVLEINFLKQREESLAKAFKS
jgi:ribosomal protein L16 Arg81 hydroxylase